MIYRRFGKTELQMPVISFGCMRSMHGWADTPLPDIPRQAQDTLRVLVETALSHGITHMETAHDYGSSERQLGAILAQMPRHRFLLQTKVPPGDDPGVFVSRVEQSLRRLQVDRLDLLALHGINDHRSLWYSCRKNGCLAAARRLQDQGIVGHVGFSGHGPADVILDAVSHEEDGGFDFVNLHWYFIFDVNRPAIERAVERDLGVFIISPTDKGGHLHAPPAELRECCAPLSPMLFNDLYCLQQPGVCTISVGAAAPEQFDEHLLALERLRDHRLVSQISSRLERLMLERTGRSRPDTLWNELPPWDETPGAVNVRYIIWLYHLCRGWGMETYARARYAMLNQGSSWVPGNDGSRAARYDFSELDVHGLTTEDLQELVSRAHTLLKPQATADAAGAVF